MSREKLFNGFLDGKKQPSIGPVLLIVLSVLVISSSGIIGFFFFSTGQKASIDLALNIHDSLLNGIENDLNNFLFTSHSLNKINAGYIKNDLANLKDLPGLRKRFLNLIKHHDSVTASAFGAETGNFIGTGKRPRGIFDCAIADKEKDNDYRVYLMDEMGEPYELLKTVKDYDPRLRSWYQTAVKAKGPAWSPIYVWASQANIGVSAVLPVYDGNGAVLGVLQSAVSLGHISQFLQNIKKYYSEYIYIVDGAGLLVATSGAEPLIRENREAAKSRPKRIGAKESANQLIRFSANYLTTQSAGHRKSPDRHQATLAIDGERHVLSITPYAGAFGLDWFIVIATPENALMEPVNSSIRTSIVIGAMTLMGALLLGVILTRWITRPIVNLNAAVKTMKPGNWATIETHGRFKEINQLTLSFNLMARQLGKNFDTLEQKVRERTNRLQRVNEDLEAQIMERELAEKELLNEKRLSEYYINSLPGLFYVFDEQRFINWNSEWRRITGYSDEELTDMYGPDFFRGDERTLIKEQMGKVFQEGAAEAEAEIVTKAGRRLPYFFTGLRKKLNGKTLLIGLGIDITERRQAENSRKKLINELQEAVENIKMLSGLLPICARCKKIRDDKGYWNNLEVYIEKHSDVSFSHGMCTECSDELYGNEAWYREMKKKKD